MEIWKSIDGFVNYQVSNEGNVKSLKRYNSMNRLVKEKILKPYPDISGYLFVNLYKDNKSNLRRIHHLVAESFLNHIKDGYKKVINHKDFDRSNNKLINLEIVSQRENANQKHIASSSKYTGVYWNKNRKAWRAHIRIGKKQKHLGYYSEEYDAHLAYENELKKTLNNI